MPFGVPFKQAVRALNCFEGGATTLEALGLSLDPIRRELEPLPLILAAV